ncbi:hypothetical protein [Acinetobacter sp. WZC-1]|uniref:hypothetical protein n=1 Tax=Acinetobacter sp. WZC-1 TaxID=3459034 RepID=UPI00403DE859
MTITNDNTAETSSNTYQIEEQRIISRNKFIFLCLISLGLYEVWWLFKAWRFFMRKDRLNIMPALRAVFAIFFLYSLFNHIKSYAKEKHYSDDFSAGWMFIGYIVMLLSIHLPDPYWLISTFSFVFLLPAFEALNYAKKQSSNFVVIEQEKFNTAQIILIIICSIFWILTLIGLFFLELQ